MFCVRILGWEYRRCLRGVLEKDSLSGHTAEVGYRCKTSCELAIFLEDEAFLVWDELILQRL